MDVGSGGVMMLPAGSDDPYPDLAVQAGKDGVLKLFNRDNMSTPTDVHQFAGVLVRSFFLHRLNHPR